MSSWMTIDKKTLLHFQETVLEKFSEYIQLGDDAVEAGGLLLGSVHGAHMLVIEATGPSEWDHRYRFMFERQVSHHRDIAESRWMESNGIVRYLGEWHTHPEDHPKPSEIDKTEWYTLSTKRLDKRPLLSVIVGRQDLYVGLVPGLKLFPKE